MCVSQKRKALDCRGLLCVVKEGYMLYVFMFERLGGRFPDPEIKATRFISPQMEGLVIIGPTAGSLLLTPRQPYNSLQ